MQRKVMRKQIHVYIKDILLSQLSMIPNIELSIIY